MTRSFFLLLQISKHGLRMLSWDHVLVANNNCILALLYSHHFIQVMTYLDLCCHLENLWSIRQEDVLNCYDSFRETKFEWSINFCILSFGGKLYQLMRVVFYWTVIHVHGHGKIFYFAHHASCESNALNLFECFE
jgi:hypothetical protein